VDFLHIHAKNPDYRAPLAGKACLPKNRSFGTASVIKYIIFFQKILYRPPMEAFGEIFSVLVYLSAKFGEISSFQSRPELYLMSIEIVCIMYEDKE
jgi:hypothetical protein